MALTDLDFDQEGKRAAMINFYGRILISDVNTNAEISFLKQINPHGSTFESKILFFPISLFMSFLWAMRSPCYENFIDS